MPRASAIFGFFIANLMRFLPSFNRFLRSIAAPLPIMIANLRIFAPIPRATMARIPFRTFGRATVMNSLKSSTFCLFAGSPNHLKILSIPHPARRIKNVFTISLKIFESGAVSLLRKAGLAILPAFPSFFLSFSALSCFSSNLACSAASSFLASVSFSKKLRRVPTLLLICFT